MDWKPEPGPRRTAGPRRRGRAGQRGRVIGRGLPQVDEVLGGDLATVRARRLRGEASLF